MNNPRQLLLSALRIACSSFSAALRLTRTGVVREDVCAGRASQTNLERREGFSRVEKGQRGKGKEQVLGRVSIPKLRYDYGLGFGVFEE